MGADYPEHVLARGAAPPYRGEGELAVWHFSEDPSLARFEPRSPTSQPERGPLVWAVDTRHAPMFWFPRDCPRGCIWPSAKTTAEDRERFFGQSATTRVHVIEASWLDRVRACRLFAYRLPTEPFRPHDEVGGYWIADEPVDAAGTCGGRRPPQSARSSGDRAARHAVDLAVLAAGRGLDAGVQRLAAPQRRPASRPVRVTRWAPGHQGAPAPETTP